MFWDQTPSLHVSIMSADVAVLASLFYTSNTSYRKWQALGVLSGISEHKKCRDWILQQWMTQESFCFFCLSWSMFNNPGKKINFLGFTQKHFHFLNLLNLKWITVIGFHIISFDYITKNIHFLIYIKSHEEYVWISTITSWTLKDGLYLVMHRCCVGAK